MKVQLDFGDRGAAVLEDMKQRAGLKTHEDLLNHALTVLDWAIRQRAEGRIVASVDEQHQNYRELEMPALENAAPSILSEVRRQIEGAIGTGDDHDGSPDADASQGPDLASPER